MNLKEELARMQQEHDLTYKEARHLILAQVRKLYENETITKEQWKNIKKHVKEELK